MVTHVRSFKEYVDDLEIFVAREVAQKIAATKSPEISAPAAEERFIYVANSMAGGCGVMMMSEFTALLYVLMNLDFAERYFRALPIVIQCLTWFLRRRLKSESE